MFKRSLIPVVVLAIGVVPALSGTALAGTVPRAGQPAAVVEPAAQPGSEASLPPVTQVGEELATSVAVSYAGTGRRQIRHPGATYVKVHFASLRLAPGDYVTVADPARREVHTYHGDPAAGTARAGDSGFTRHGSTGFAAMSIDGDAAVVTLHKVAARASAATRDLGVKVDRFWRGYTPTEVAEHNPQLFSVCGADARRDAECYRTTNPTEFAKGQAVAKLLMGGSSCTAWRVGNTNRLLTNNHCMATQSAVASSETQFNYQCATCGGNNPGAGTKVGGATMFKTSTGGSGALDYTLYSVNNFANIQQFGTLFLETRAPVNGERIYIPGHGDGRPKRISIYEETQGTGFCTVRSANADSYNMSYSCDTSGGNSGSPVLSAAHKVLALHHLGGCPNNKGARINMIYNEIRDLIDNNSGGTPSPTPTGTPTTSPTASPTTTPGGCASHPNRFTGSLATGASAYQPNNSYFQTTSSGAHSACLDGPAGTDFDLYLQKWNGSAWANVASGTTSTSDETVTYTGAAGYYRYRVHAYSGSGSYTLGYTRPA